MKKAILIFLCVMLLLSCSGCGPLVAVNTDDTKEKAAYGDAVAALFQALDKGDREAVRSLFVPSAREQAADFEEQLAQLFSVYAGPTDAIGWDGLGAMGANYDHGKHRKCISANFPVRSGDAYYWCYLKLLYENTLEDGGTGILQLDFYTAAERCALEYSEGKILDHAGLRVHAAAAQEGEIRCISGHPYLYTPSAEPLELEAVKSFLETSTSFYSFQKQFGAPNAENIFHYYPLPAENGAPRYLQLSIHQDVICSATVVNEFEYLQTVYAKPE